VSDNEGVLVRLSRSWRTRDGVTIPAGTEIWVTDERERELREGDYLADLNTADVPITLGPEEDDEMFVSYGPEEPDEDFLDVRGDDPEGS
jgi:hypothetical protein